MHLETTSVSTTSYNKASETFAVETTESSSHVNRQRRDEAALSRGDDPPLEDAPSWYELSTKVSSDTASVFPLLCSKSSSSVWQESVAANEDEKGKDASFGEVNGTTRDDVVDLSRNRTNDPIIYEDVWTFSQRANALVGDEDNGDDDSSAALSLYLESKLAAALHEGESDTRVSPGARAADDIPKNVVTRKGASIGQLQSEQSTTFSQRQLLAMEEKKEAESPSIKQSPKTPVPPPLPLNSDSRRQSAPGFLDGMPRRSLVEGSSMKLEEQLPAHAISTPRAPSYNPMTNHSPDRQIGKRIWLSNVPIPRSSRRSLTPERTSIPEELDDDDEESSMTSEEVLERWSSKIRGELRYAELVELAEEAERAAESGVESYFGRPWLYTEPGESPQMMMRPGHIKRHASYSEGLPMPTSPLRTATAHPTLPSGIRMLRDAEDVFPPFDSFHRNLRTHFFRSNVPEKALIFEEEEDIDESSVNYAEHPFRSKDFMHSFNFDILRRSRGPREGSTEEIDNGDNGNESDGSLFLADDDDEASGASTVGEALAGHIHSTEKPVRHFLHPVSLPGLPKIVSMQPARLDGSHHKPVSAPGEHRVLGHSPSVDEDGLAQPRVLFPGGAPLHVRPAQQNHEVLAEEMSPTVTLNQKKSHDFVTPARLREIRRPKEDDLHQLLIEESMILPANSVIQESPYRTTPVGMRSPSRASASSRRIAVTDLLLPAFSMGNDEDDAASLQLLESNSVDTLEDDISPNPLSPQDKALANKMTARARVAAATPSGQESQEQSKEITACDPPENSPQAEADNEASPTERTFGQRRANLSIHNGRPDPPGRDAVYRSLRPLSSTTDRGNGSPKNQKVLSMRNEVGTPQASFDFIDCRCLSSEVTMSPLHDLLDDGDEGIATDRPAGTPKRGTLQGAMNMLKKLSPRRDRDRPVVQSVDLFVPPRVNDDFLQNYLYCTKDPTNPEKIRHGGGDCMTTDSCQDDGFCGIGLTVMNNYCGLMAKEVDCAAALRSRQQGKILPLTLHAQKHEATETENWFDSASERVDGILENLVRGFSTPKENRFQPPSLRKIMRSEAKIPLAAASLDAGPVLEGGAEPLTEQSRPVVQALFKHEEEDLSDTQFALVYGTSRADFKATTSPLRVNQEEPIRHTAILQSYSSSSDEGAEALSLTYISEPSLDVN